MRKLSESYGENQVLRFDTVKLNDGNGYNIGTGKFTAPVGGVYLFWGHVTSYNDGSFALKLMTKHGEGARGWTSTGLKNGAATVTYVMRVEKGEQVWFAISPRPANSVSSVEGDNQYSSIGGVLIS